MSFSQEMKDFLGAYDKVSGVNLKGAQTEKSQADTDATQKKTLRDNDPATLALASATAQAKLDKLKGEIADAGSTRADAHTESVARAKLYNDLLGRNSLMPPGTPTGTPTGTATPAVGGAGVAPANTNPALTTQAEEEAGGGLVYQEGGAIPDTADDDDDDEESTPAPAAAAPAVGAVPVPAPRPAIPPTADASSADVTDFSSRGRSRGGGGYPASTKPPPDPVVKANGAIQGGYDFTNQLLGRRGGVPTADQQLMAKAIASGHGGFTPEEMQALGKKVDPDGKMSESTRNMTALGEMYQFWVNKGDPEKAQRVAFQMLQHYRQATTMYSSIAARAAESGNLDLMQKAAIKAYANVPDGKEMELMPDPDSPGHFIYSFTNADGKVVQQGIASPKEIAAGAMGLAKGGFDKALLTAAGQQEQQGAVGAGGGKPPPPQSSGDLKAQGELVKAELDKHREAWTKAQGGKVEAGPAFDDAEDAANIVLKNALNSHSTITPRQAAQAGMALTMPGAKDPEKLDYQIRDEEKDDEKTGNSIVKFKNGVQIVAPTSQLQPFIDKQSARVKAATDEINKKMEEEDASDARSKSRAEGASDVWQGVKRVAGEAGDAAGTMGRIAGRVAKEAVPDELRERVGADLPNIWSWVKSKTTNTGAIPDSAGEDRPL